VSPSPTRGSEAMQPGAITIQAAFEGCRAQSRKALIPYLTCGFPDADTSLALMGALTEEGADILELGIPFSDPLADGPTIQQSSFRALQGGMSVAGVLEVLRRFRADHVTPVVIFTYLNPVLRYGLSRFLRDATEAGAQGLLITDLPTGADEELENLILASDLDLIRLVAPTTPRGRVRAVAGGGGGFLYYISRTGVTGGREELRSELGREVEALRREVSLPVAVGFGIATPEQAALVAAVADGVVVGSALMVELEVGGMEAARSFLRGLRRGMDG
jgi:tryptophan synthase alpha chain